MSDAIKLIEDCIQKKTQPKKANREDLYNLGIAILTDAGYNKPVDCLKSMLKEEQE